ncbi:MAG TPA: RnfABCDGE type electron transport complex subunit D, partial [Bacteroidales bacterium]|nr:RnfABCDGE type electron transport complex subunit D [Bacteroidales bacterium]
MKQLTISGSPHVHGQDTIRGLMYGVVLAMVPAMLVSVYFFGLDAVRVMLISVGACLLFEFLIQKYLLKGPVSITDGSAVITGILLSFNVPSNLPWGILLIGALVAIGIGKMSFGGLGRNIFNPALVGRVFLLISFPVQMTTWPIPRPIVAEGITDAITGPTPLGILKEGLRKGESLQDLSSQLPDYLTTLMGNHGGCLGEVSAIALLIGAAYMLVRRIITWHIPAAYLGSVVLFSGIFWLIDPTYYADPLFHLLTGGMILGIFFMATDYTTSPMSPSAQLVYGAGAGIITMIIRIWGAYPEGVSFAILIMNAVVPLLDRGLKPRRFGEA